MPGQGLNVMHGKEVSRGIAKGILSRYLTGSPKHMGCILKSQSRLPSSWLENREAAWECLIRKYSKPFRNSFDLNPAKLFQSIFWDGSPMPAGGTRVCS